MLPSLLSFLEELPDFTLSLNGQQNQSKYIRFILDWLQRLPGSKT